MYQGEKSKKVDNYAPISLSLPLHFSLTSFLYLFFSLSHLFLISSFLYLFFSLYLLFSLSSFLYLIFSQSHLISISSFLSLFFFLSLLFSISSLLNIYLSIYLQGWISWCCNEAKLLWRYYLPVPWKIFCLCGGQVILNSVDTNFKIQYFKMEYLLQTLLIKHSNVF